MKALLCTAAVALLMAGAPAPAAPDPADWLRALYERYHRAEKDDKLAPDSAETVAAAHASRAFKALLQRDLACEDKSHLICALDWDFFIDGQAWELKNVVVGPLQVSGAQASVTVSFENLKAIDRNLYKFVREDGAWKLDDVVTGQRGRPQMSVSIAKLLRDYKF